MEIRLYTLMIWVEVPVIVCRCRPRYLLDRLCGLQSQSGRCGEREKCCPCRESNFDSSVLQPVEESLYLTEVCVTRGEYMSCLNFRGSIDSLCSSCVRLTSSFRLADRVTFILNSWTFMNWYSDAFISSFNASLCLTLYALCIVLQCVWK